MKNTGLEEAQAGTKMARSKAGDTGLIRGSGRSPGEGHAIPLQYSCLENPMDRGEELAGYKL